MNRGVIALAVAGLLFVAAVLLVVLTRPEHTVVRHQPAVTTPIISSPLTPLETRRARRSVAARSPDSRRGRSFSKHATQTHPAPAARPKSRNRHVQAPKAPRRRRRPPQRPAQGAQPPQTQPPSRPPADVQVPAPVTVCVRGVGGVNCP